MKRMVRANSSLSILSEKTGSAGPANKREGKLKFGAGHRVDLGNGWSMQFPTGVARIDIDTGIIDIYCNLYLKRNDEFHERGIIDGIEYTGCTAEEATEIYNAARNATYEELVDLVCHPL